MRQRASRLGDGVFWVHNIDLHEDTKGAVDTLLAFIQEMSP